MARRRPGRGRDGDRSRSGSGGLGWKECGRPIGQLRERSGHLCQHVQPGDEVVDRHCEERELPLWKRRRGCGLLGEGDERVDETSDLGRTGDHRDGRLERDPGQCRPTIGRREDVGEDLLGTRDRLRGGRATPGPGELGDGVAPGRMYLLGPLRTDAHHLARIDAGWQRGAERVEQAGQRSDEQIPSDHSDSTTESSRAAVSSVVCS